MKEIDEKSASAIIVIVLLCFVFFLGLGSTSESYCWLKPYIDTKFAKDYTPEKFELIKLGMKEETVKTLVGEPIGTYEQINFPQKEVYYTQDGFLFEKADKKGIEGADFAWYMSTITYNENKEVIKIDKGWSFD